ncbi:MAG: molecular chaperone TorD family protein [Deltaproteobacteria bacterium]|nr:molecular chaperone TorD family protein [Deltaproteobacteria bacterium]
MSHMAQELTALHRADLYRVLALGFDDPRPETVQPLVALLKDLDLPSGSDALREPVRRLVDLLQSAGPNAVRSEYLRLFVTEVSVAPCEGNYHAGDRGTVVGDVAAFYRAFGMETPAATGPVDQLKSELAFLSWLALKEVNARHHGLAVQAEITQAAASHFLADHIGRWVGHFAAAVKAATSEPFYLQLVELLVAWIKQDCVYFGISPVPLPAGLASAGGEVMACPFSETCASETILRRES